MGQTTPAMLGGGGGVEWDRPIKGGMNHFVEMTEISMEISRKQFLIFYSVMPMIRVSIMTLHTEFFSTVSVSHFFPLSPLITNFIISSLDSFFLWAFHVLYFAAWHFHKEAHPLAYILLPNHLLEIPLFSTTINHLTLKDKIRGERWALSIHVTCNQATRSFRDQDNLDSQKRVLFNTSFSSMASIATVVRLSVHHW